MKCVQEVKGNRVEEELVVPYTGGLVLLLEDLVIVNARLEVVGTIPSKSEVEGAYSKSRLRKMVCGV